MLVEVFDKVHFVCGDYITIITPLFRLVHNIVLENFHAEFVRHFVSFCENKRVLCFKVVTIDPQHGLIKGLDNLIVESDFPSYAFVETIVETFVKEWTLFAE